MEQTESPIASIRIDDAERDRILQRATASPVFLALGETFVELVTSSGLPVGEIEQELLQTSDLIALFRILLTAWTVNARLAGRSLPDRLTEEEWRERYNKEEEKNIRRHLRDIQNQLQRQHRSAVNQSEIPEAFRAQFESELSREFGKD